MSSPPKVSLYVGCMNAIYTVAHILMGGAVFLTFALADLNENALYKAHACTTIIGVTLLCSQAVLSVNPYVGFEDNFMYPQKSKTYWLIQILGSALVLSGACIGIASVGETVSAIDDFPFPIPGLPGVSVKHLQTDHGIIGFLVLLLAAVTLVGAIANLVIAERLKSFMKILYMLLGTGTIILAYIAVCIKFGDYNKTLSLFGDEIAILSLGISFSVLSFGALLVMMGGRVFVTRSIQF